MNNINPFSLTESDQLDGEWSAEAYQELQENSDSSTGQYFLQ